MKEIILNNGMKALVDDGDYDRLSRYSWRYMQSGQTVYAARTEVRRDEFGRRRQRSVWMHREVLCLPGLRESGLRVDHLDHNGLNNQKHNLRIATKEQNMGNLVSPNMRKGGLKGVSYTPNRKTRPWLARIFHNGQTIHLGRFSTSVEAAMAYDRKARELHGQFALVNFP